jgi:glycerophosphoryl diester phosphodiesterase
LIDFHRRPDGRVLEIGHRGAAALAPENTLRAFEAAIGLGVDFVEFDVLELADGTLVVAHSDDLAEVSHGAARGRVARLTLGELRELAPELPTLAEALDFFAARPEVGVHVDVKTRRGGPIAAELERRGLVARTIASSFWPEALRALRSASSELALALTYPEDRRGIARRRFAGPLVVPAVVGLGKVLPLRLPRLLAAADARVAMLHYGVVSRAAVDRCHERGIAVWAWTVNERRLLDRLVALGVDGIVSDDPRLFPPSRPERLLN